MSPLDDELRRALQSRASRVTSAVDPLVGIERRARQIRRNRLRSVAAGVVVVAGLGIGVPVALSAGSDSAGPSQQATLAPPPPSPSAPAPPSNVVDWPLTGTAQPDLLQAAETAYVPSTGSRPSGQARAHVIAGGALPDGTRYLLAQLWFDGQPVADTVTYVVHGDGSAEPGVEAVLDQPSPLAAMFLTGTQILVVPNPSIKAVEYARDGKTFVRAGTVVDRGSAADDPQAHDLLRYTYAGGQSGTLSTASTLCGVVEC